jgi:hypothetical protein
MFFINGCILGLAINRRAGRKNKVFNPRFSHGVKDVYRSVNIIKRIFLRVFHGFAHSLESSEVNKRVE